MPVRTAPTDRIVESREEEVGAAPHLDVRSTLRHGWPSGCLVSGDLPCPALRSETALVHLDHSSEV